MEKGKVKQIGEVLTLRLRKYFTARKRNNKTVHFETQGSENNNILWIQDIEKYILRTIFQLQPRCYIVCKQPLKATTNLFFSKTVHSS
jgi:hypothetical protein